MNINCATDVTIYANVSTLRNNTKPVFTTAKYNFNLTGDALLKYNICKRQTWDRVDRYERIVVERIEAFHHY